MAQTRLRLSQKTIDRYRANLDIAERKFDAEARPMIEQMHSYLKGQQWAASSSSTRIRKLVANLILADVKVMLPALTLRNPRIFIKPVGAMRSMPIIGPTGPQMVPVQILDGKPVNLIEAARAKEALVNWRWRMLRTNQQVRRCLVDALTAPFGVMKLGYTLLTEKLVMPDDPYTGDIRQIETHELIKAESPFAIRWSPLDFRVDPEARYPDLSDAAWIAFGWTARLTDVQDNSRYKNTRDLKGTAELKTTYDAPGSPPSVFARSGSKPEVSEEEYQRVRMWEIWDKRNHMRIVLADDHDKALEYADWPQAYRNFPCETLCFLEHPDQLYGPPDLWHVLGQQDAYNQVITMIHNHVRRTIPKYGATRGAIDDKEMEKLQLGEDSAVVEIDGKLGDSFGPLAMASAPTDWWQARVNFREDHDRISGIGDFMRAVAEKVDTATEANLLQANLSIRTNDTRQLVENFAERVAGQLLQIDVQTIDLPRAIPIIGPDGVIALNDFVHIEDQNLLLAETDVEIEVGSMQPTNQVIRKQDALQVFQILRNDPLTDQFELRKKLIPAFRDSIPDFDKMLLTREQMAMVAQQMGVQAPGAGPGGQTGAPGPAGGGSRPGSFPGARPAQPPGRPPNTPGPPGLGAEV